MRTPARWGLAVAAVALAVGTAGPARGAVLWTLTASPLTVTTGVQTTFSLRASMTLLGAIRCVDVGVPGNFTVHGAAVVGSNAGSWVSQVNGNEVLVATSGGGLRLVGNYVDFTITATATSTGALAWDSHAHAQGDCAGAESLLSVPPVVLVLGPAVTPTPAPTVAPTPPPTPRPTVAPTPVVLPSIPPLPSIQPLPSIPLPGSSATPRPSSAPPEATPDPSAAVTRPSRDPRPAASDAPEPSDASSPSPDAVGSPRPDDATGLPSGDGAAPPTGRILAEPPVGGGTDPAPVPVGLGALGLLASIDIWIVPGLLLGVPGLLVVAFVALQAVGALAWIPAIRRLRGQEVVANQ